VLRFGEFTLKSGRVSPYFFNAGLFNTRPRHRRLGRHYARAAALSGIGFDMLFGPATRASLRDRDRRGARRARGHNLPFAFNRKEAKDHGEAARSWRALAGTRPDRDDVMTAAPPSASRSGSSAPTARRRPGADRARPRGARPGRALGGAGGAGDLRPAGGQRARLRDLVEHLESAGDKDFLEAVRAYRNRYGV